MLTLGRQLVDSVTSGLYDDPLMVLREYIQNAADAVDQAVASGRPQDGGRIDVTVDGRERRITVEDNGTGYGHEIRIGGVPGRNRPASVSRPGV